jgi:hypothetical protein
MSARLGLTFLLVLPSGSTHLAAPLLSPGLSGFNLILSLHEIVPKEFAHG